MKLQDSDQRMSARDNADEIVDLIVDALRAKFGADALAVAKLQAEHASPDSASQWREIVTRLSV